MKTEYASVLQDVNDVFVSGNIGTLIDDYNTANNRDHNFCPTVDTLQSTAQGQSAFFVALLASVPAIDYFGRLFRQ